MIKRSNTKELLADSLLDLADSKSVSKIHVRDITENCGISYPMFYYYYKDMDDLINNIFRRDFDERMGTQTDGFNYTWALQQLSDLICSRYDFYLNVLQNTSGINSLYNFSAQYVLKYFEDKIRPAFKDNTIPDHLRTMLEFHIMGIRSKTCDMIVSGTRKPADFVINSFTEALPSDLKPYLLS